MGTALTPLQIGSSYAGLLKTTDNAVLDAAYRTITDGMGNDSALQVSTGGVKSTGTLDVAGNAAVVGNGTVGGTLSVTGLVKVGGSTPVAGTYPGFPGTAGTAGTITWDADYIYVCFASPGYWKRAALSSY